MGREGDAHPPVVHWETDILAHSAPSAAPEPPQSHRPTARSPSPHFPGPHRRSPAMRDRHWRQLLRVTKQTTHIDPESDAFSLKDLLELGLHAYVEDVANIVEKATKELGIERNLEKIVGPDAPLLSCPCAPYALSYPPLCALCAPPMNSVGAFQAPRSREGRATTPPPPICWEHPVGSSR